MKNMNTVCQIRVTSNTTITTNTTNTAAVGLGHPRGSVVIVVLDVTGQIP